MAETIILSELGVPAAVEKASSVLLGNGLVVYPTDTLYGIGCIATNHISVQKLFAIKKRDSSKLVSVMVSPENLSRVARANPEQLALLGSLVPGPYTFLLEPSGQLDYIAGERIAIRVPDDPFCLGLLKRVDFVTSTSANLSGSPAPYSFSVIDQSILSQVDLAIDSGECRFKTPSTIIDLVKGKIIREGAGLEKARKALAQIY